MAPMETSIPSHCSISSPWTNWYKTCDISLMFEHAVMIHLFGTRFRS